MGKMLGIKSVEMYVGMIKDDFDPLINSLVARGAGIEEEVEKQVKIDFGVYKFYQEKAALELRLREINTKLGEFETKTYSEDKRYESKIDREKRKRVDELNGPLLESTKVRDDLIRQVKLSGVGDDLKNVFEGLSIVVAELNEKFGDLPALTLADVKRLSAPKKVGKK